MICDTFFKCDGETLATNSNLKTRSGWSKMRVLEPSPYLWEHMSCSAVLSSSSSVYLHCLIASLEVTFAVIVSCVRHFCFELRSTGTLLVSPALSLLFQRSPLLPLCAKSLLKGKSSFYCKAVTENTMYVSPLCEYFING